MKLLMISAAYPPHPSGEGYYVKALAEGLAARSHQVEIWTSVSDAAIPNSVSPVHARMKAWRWKDLGPLLGHIRRMRPDSIVLHYTDWMYPHPMITILPTLLRVLGLPIQFVTVLQNPIHRSHAPNFVRTRGVRGKLNRWRRVLRHGGLLHHSDWVVVLAQWHRAAIARLYPPVADRCVVLPVFSFLEPAPTNTGGERRRLRSEFALDESAFVIAFYGFIYAGKDMGTLLRALKLLRDRSLNAHLLLVGDSPDTSAANSEEWRTLADELGVRAHITALGTHLSLESRPSRALQSADVCVLPFAAGVCTRRSSFAAAAIHGLPVVTTLGPESDETFIDGENILAYRHGDASDLALKLATLLSDPELGHALGRGALNLAENVFSRRKTTERYERILQDGVS